MIRLRIRTAMIGAALLVALSAITSNARAADLQLQSIDVQTLSGQQVQLKFHLSGPAPEPMATIEPPQHALRTVVLHETTQPIFLEGYHRPDYRSPDDATYEAMTDIFSNGRTSRLYRSLERDKRIALA